MVAPALDIILVAKNQLEYTRICLESIFTNVSSPFRIIFIDNASTDETPAYLAGSIGRCPGHGSVVVIRNEENLGWVKGLNQGIRRSEAPYVMFLNNDTEIFPGAIEEMISLAASDPHVGSVNPASNEFDIDRKNWEVTKKREGQRTELYHAAGFCMLLKREAIEQVGEIDEIYSPGYFEEMDYSERMRQKGFFCVLARGAYVFHYGSRSFQSSEKQALWERNEKVFYSRWGEDRRFAYVGSGKVGWDQRAQKDLAQTCLELIRKNKTYAYLFLPAGTKDYFESLHVGFRVMEVPAGFRWLMLILKTFRVPRRKKIDTIYFSSPAHLALGARSGIFRGVRLETLPSCEN